MNKSYRIIVTVLLSGLCLNQATAEPRSVAHEEMISIEEVDQLDLSEVLAEKSHTWFRDSLRINLGYQMDSLHKDEGYREFEAGVEWPLWRRSRKKAFKSLAKQSAIASSQDALHAQKNTGDTRLANARIRDRFSNR